MAAIALLAAGPASAQIAGGGGRDARIETAYAQWRRLPQREVNCVDRSLRAQHSNLWSAIQRGIEPTNSTVARIRNACRAEATARPTVPAAPKASQALAESDLRTASQLADNAADQPAADKAAAEKAEALKAAAAAKAEALRLAEAKAARDKAAADKAAAEKAAGEKAIAEKIAAKKPAAETAGGDKPVPEKPVAAKPAVQKLAATKPVAEVAALAPEKADAARAKPDAAAHPKAEPPKAEPSKAEPPRVETKTMAVVDPVAFTAAELRTSFVYGLISGPILFCLGGVVFLFLGRVKIVTAATPEAVAFGLDEGEQARDADRRAAAAMVKQARRGKTKPIAPGREQPVGMLALQ